jgi:hypothetical protein
MYEKSTMEGGYDVVLFRCMYEYGNCIKSTA